MHFGQTPLMPVFWEMGLEKGEQLDCLPSSIVQQRKFRPSNWFSECFLENSKGWGLTTWLWFTLMVSLGKSGLWLIFSFWTVSLRAILSWKIHLKQHHRLHTALSGDTKEFIQLFSHIKYYSPKWIKRFWCVKLAHTPLTSSSCTDSEMKIFIKFKPNSQSLLLAFVENCYSDTKTWSSFTD